MQNKEKNTKIVEGTVVGNKMQKTVKVAIDVPIRHPVYRKIVTKRRVFFAHTEEMCEMGQVVKITPSRPYSKNVRWVVIKN